MSDSQRKIKTMEFFNMLNEPERSQAIANYDEACDSDTPSDITEAVALGFNWYKTPQGRQYWDKIKYLLSYKAYNFKTEPMETQNELDYMISVMQAKKEGKEIECCKRGLSVYNNTGVPIWDWSAYHYRVKPEPPKPKTEKFTFADADFLLGLKVRSTIEDWKFIITSVTDNSMLAGKGKIEYGSDSTEYLEYQDRITLEWKPFEKVTE